MTGSVDGKDTAWEEALDWLLRVQAAPGDRSLKAARDAWLAASRAHADAYRRAEKVWQLTGEVPTATRWPAPRRPWRGRAVVLAAGLVAACLALALAPALMLRFQADYRTATGEERAVGLADGSVIDLDTDSAVAVDYGPDGRAVSLLAGRAFFEVAADRRPFTVRAGDVAVTVAGTAFDVRLGPDRIAVAVQRGSVTVGTGGQRAPVRLGPGDRLRIDRATGAVTRDCVVRGQIAAWRHGRLIADGASLGDLAAELDRYHAGYILVRDPVLAGRRVSGIYDLRNPEAALRAMVQPHGGRVSRLTPYLLVVEGAAP